MRLLALPLLLALPACFNPDNILILHGSVTSPDPVDGLAVRLLRGIPASDDSACVARTPFKETTVDETGSWSFEVFQAQALRLAGRRPFCFRAETTFPSSSEAFAELQGLYAAVEVTPFPDWRAQPSRVDGVLRFEPAAPLPAEEAVVGVQLTHRAEWVTADGGVAWVGDDRVVAFSVPPAQEGPTPIRQLIALDDVMLEDFSGSVRLSARLYELREGGPFGGGSPEGIEARSAQTLALAGTRAPISRGLACPAVGTPCPLTDGDLTVVDAGVRTLTLRLPSPVPLSAVVLRGVETSAALFALSLTGGDGGVTGPPLQVLLPSSTWSGAGGRIIDRLLTDGGREITFQPEATWAVLRLDAGVPIDSVTLTFPGGLERAAEISLVE